MEADSDPDVAARSQYKYALICIFTLSHESALLSRDVKHRQIKTKGAKNDIIYESLLWNSYNLEMSQRFYGSMP